MRGIIAATRTDCEESGVRALLRVGGISILERQLRILRKAGVNDVLVVAARRDERIQSEIDRLAGLKMRVRLVWPEEGGGLDLSGTFAEVDDQPWLLLDGASLFDERIVGELTRPDREKIAVLPEDRVSSDDAGRALRLSIDKASAVFFGMARLSAGQLAALRPQSGDGWLRELFEAIAGEDPEAVLDVSGLPTYSYDMRRDMPYLWMPVSRPEDNHRGKDALLNAAQKSVLDWPAWYIHRPIEKRIVYHICETSITPNQITVINNIVAFSGIYFFATGSLFWAMVAALAVGVLDGLDGKLARTKVMTSKIGRLEELFDKIYENGWYLTMAYWLVGQGYGAHLYALFGLIFLLNMADIALGLVSKSRLGIQLDDAGDFERGFRKISGRRNTFIWTLIPFLLFGSLYAGYWMIVVYDAVTVAVRAWRLSFRLEQYKENREGTTVDGA